MNGARAGILAVVVLGLVLGSTAAVAQSEYALSGSPAIETPTETVTYQGQTYTLDSVSRIDAEDSVTVTTSVPSGASYDLNLRGPENQLISSESMTGDGSHTLSFFGSGAAGTYAATIQDDGSTVAVHPIVIAGYDISVDDPGSVAAGDDASISVSVSERDVERHSSLDAVQVIVGNDDVEATTELTADSDGRYSGTVSTADIDTGTYNVYAVVRGDEEVRQRAELLGVSDTVELTVQPASGTATAEPSTETAAGETATAEPSTEAPATTTTTERPESTGTSTSNTRTETAATSTDGDAIPTPAETDDGVIAPSTVTETTSTAADGPGFTAALAVVAFLAIAALLARRD